MDIFKNIVRVKPTTFFVFAALFFELLFNLVTPPLQAPDEINHFFRAYQIADGNFLPVRTKDRLGGYMPICFNEFVVPFNNAATNIKYTLKKDDIIKSFDIKFNAEKVEFKDFPSTTTYSFISYLPQVSALFILKQFKCSVATMYYGGRLFSFIFWLLVMYAVITIMPVYKWLFTLIILLPMNLYLANAFSADGMNNCLTFLFMALALKHMFSSSNITLRDLIILLMILSLLALAKFVYVSFIALLFLIPARKFPSQVFRFSSIGIILTVTIFLVSIWSGIYLKNYIKISEYNQNYIYNVGLSPCADYVAQKAYILNHGFYFFKVIYHSVFDHPQTFLKGYIGAFGQADIPFPNGVYLLAYLFIVIVAITDFNGIVINTTQKIIIFLVAISAFILILLSIHLMWDCVGEGVVDLVQGRYLIPVFPLLFILFNHNRFRFNFPPLFIVFPLIIFLNFYAAKIIADRYSKETFNERTEFYCDAEQINYQNYFITSNPSVNLEIGGVISHKYTFSGQNSLLLNSAAPFGFTHKIKNLKKGDLIEVEVWKKGVEGYVALSGKLKNNEEFFLANKTPLKTLKNGWSKMLYVFTMTKECNGNEFNFFVWNPTSENVYFDDLKFSLKKFNANYLN